MTVVAWLLLAANLVLLALALVQIRRANGVEHRLIEIEVWAYEQDPAAFKIYPELGDEEPVPDCEENGGFHVATSGGGCKNCPAVLV